MSNRRSNRQDENTRYVPKGQQQKFIPKPMNPTHNSNSTPFPVSLSSSLRQSDSATASSRVSAPGVSRVRMGDQGQLVSSKSPAGSFVNYLPQDEAVAAGLGPEDGGLDPVESQGVVDLLNRELTRLLKLNPIDFWREGYGSFDFMSYWVIMSTISQFSFGLSSFNFFFVMDFELN